MITDNPQTFCFASTDPYYVEIGPSERRISEASVQFFVDWLAQRRLQIKLEGKQLREVLSYQCRCEEILSEPTQPGQCALVATALREMELRPDGTGTILVSVFLIVSLSMLSLA